MITKKKKKKSSSYLKGLKGTAKNPEPTKLPKHGKIKIIIQENLDCQELEDRKSMKKKLPLQNSSSHVHHQRL